MNIIKEKSNVPPPSIPGWRLNPQRVAYVSNPLGFILLALIEGVNEHNLIWPKWKSIFHLHLDFPQKMAPGSHLPKKATKIGVNKVVVESKKHHQGRKGTPKIFPGECHRNNKVRDWLFVGRWVITSTLREFEMKC